MGNLVQGRTKKLILMLGPHPKMMINNCAGACSRILLYEVVPEK